MDQTHANDEARDDEVRAAARRRFGAAIRRLRQERGWTQAELADRIGGKIAQGDVSALERGRVGLPHRARTERIAALFGLSLGEFLQLSGWNGADAAFPDPVRSDPIRAEFCAAIDRLEMTPAAVELLRSAIGVITLQQQGTQQSSPPASPVRPAPSRNGAEPFTRAGNGPPGTR